MVTRMCGRIQTEEPVVPGQIRVEVLKRACWQVATPIVLRTEDRVTARWLAKTLFTPSLFGRLS